MMGSLNLLLDTAVEQNLTVVLGACKTALFIQEKGVYGFILQ